MSVRVADDDLHSRDLAKLLHQLAYFLDAQAAIANAIGGDNIGALEHEAHEVRVLANRLHDMKCRLVDPWWLEQQLRNLTAACAQLRGGP